MPENNANRDKPSAIAIHQDRIRRILEYRPLWQVALSVSLVLIMILSTVRIEGPTPVTGWDKLNHMIAFIGLIALARLGWPKKPAISAAGAILAFGLLIELVQALLPYRSFSLLDWLADGVGILVGFAILHGLLAWLGLKK